MASNAKRLLFEIMEEDDRGLAGGIDLFLLLLILSNVLVVLLESVAKKPTSNTARSFIASR